MDISNTYCADLSSDSTNSHANTSDILHALQHMNFEAVCVWLLASLHRYVLDTARPSYTHSTTSCLAPSLQVQEYEQAQAEHTKEN